MEVQPDVIADRRYALRTCPARAPDRVEDDSVFGEDPYDLKANAVADELEPVMNLAEAYLKACPDDQPGGEPAFDLPGRKVLVQVTYGAEQVLSDLQAQLEDPSTVTVELVRYSAVQLQRWADEITAMPDDIGICGVGWSKTWTSPASAPPLTVSWRSTRAFSTRTRRLLTRFSTRPSPFPDNGDEIETAQGATSPEHDSRVSSTVSRGEDTTDSDIDLLVDVAPGVGLLGLARCQHELESLLDATVDLVPAEDLKPGVARTVQAEFIAM
jgi:predicted nucleotidyltransferase